MATLEEVWKNIQPSWSSLLIPPAYAYSYFNNILTTMKTGTDVMMGSPPKPETKLPQNEVGGSSAEITTPIGSFKIPTTLIIAGIVTYVLVKKI